MKVINPFNRVPETEESLAMACRCVCSTGAANTLSPGATESDKCGCSCGSGPTNMAKNANTHYFNRKRKSWEFLLNSQLHG